MKDPGAPGYFQAITCHHFERALTQAQAIGGNQNMGVALRYLQRGEQKLLKIFFDVKYAAPMGARKCRRIEDDHVELFAFAGETRQDAEHIVGDELVFSR